MKRILFIVGSLREKSFNRQLAKKAAISGAGGKAATANCRQKLTELLEFLKADVLPFQTGIALQPDCWTTDTLILTDEDQKNLAAETELFLSLI